ncbi:hypothetical protein Ancab_034089 [Ancistrocladus abbreviatus]
MGQLGETTTPPPPATTNPRPMPVRDDCWSEEATFTLIEAWGQRYLELNRANLRQKHWHEVADAVNDRHGHIKKARRTDVQCKNRIDTLKKKYKIEKARVLESYGSFVIDWPFFTPLGALIGSTMTTSLALKKSSPSPQPDSAGPPMGVPLLVPYGRTPPAAVAAAATTVVPQKRPSSTALDESYFRKNYSVVAAAAAAAETDEDDEEEMEESRSSGETGDGDGIRKLARVIETFGEVYARVEAEKQRQLIELEKQRMQFAKELECQRMQMLAEMQVQLEKTKRAKKSNSNVFTRGEENDS